MDICEWRGGALGKAAVVRGMLEVPNRAPMDCFVIHLSDTSAWIALADTPSLGDQATLIIPGRNISRPCLVVQHGSDDTFGLAFAEAATS